MMDAKNPSLSMLLFISERKIHHSNALSKFPLTFHWLDVSQMPIKDWHKETGLLILSRQFMIHFSWDRCLYLCPTPVLLPPITDVLIEKKIIRQIIHQKIAVIKYGGEGLGVFKELETYEAYSF